MELRKDKIGKKVFLQGIGYITINEQNAEILKQRGLHQFFLTGIELQPLPVHKLELDESSDLKIVLTDEPEPGMEWKKFEDHLNGKAPSMSDDLKYLRDQIFTQALTGFEGRVAKMVKKDLDLLGIEYPKNASLAMLAEIVKTQP